MDNFLYNLKCLSEIYSQKDISQKTGYSASSINNYLSGKSQPSAQFLLKLKDAYKIDIDQFLSTKMDKNNFMASKLNYRKFLGSYIVYYYNSSAYKGKVTSYNYDVLTFGVITIIDDIDYTAPKGIFANGLFMLTRMEAEKYLQTLESFNGDIEKIKAFYKTFQGYYYGNLEQNAIQLFISLANNNDKCLIILNNPPSTKKYRGGIGTVNSISRGREQVPCVQYILLSNVPFTIPDGEIYNLLTLGVGDINVKNETNALMDLLTNLYLENQDMGLNDYQKRKIIEDSIKNIVENAVEANLFRFAKVSNMEDDQYYRLIKDANYE